MDMLYPFLSSIYSVAPRTPTHSVHGIYAKNRYVRIDECDRVWLLTFAE